VHVCDCAGVNTREWCSLALQLCWRSTVARRKHARFEQRAASTRELWEGSMERDIAFERCTLLLSRYPLIYFLFYTAPASDAPQCARLIDARRSGARARFRLRSNVHSPASPLYPGIQWHRTWTRTLTFWHRHVHSPRGGVSCPGELPLSAVCAAHTSSHSVRSPWRPHNRAFRTGGEPREEDRQAQDEEEGDAPATHGAHGAPAGSAQC